MLQRLLVPLDGSAYSEQALAHAMEIARRLGAQLTLVRVLDHEQWPVVEERHVHEAQRELEHLAQQARESGVAHVQIEVRVGSPAHELVSCAAEREADLVVMSTHGTGLAGFALGSVALHVLMTAPCPVYLVRVPQREMLDTDPSPPRAQ